LKIERRSYLIVAASAALALSALAPGLSGVASAGSASSSTHLTFAGTTGLATSGSDSATDTLNDQTAPAIEADSHPPKNPNLNHVAASGVPRPAGNALASGQLANFGGFNGINHRNQRRSGTGVYTNTNFSLEPPDQGLCVGGNSVVETVNDAVRVFSKSGTPRTSTMALNQFLLAKPSVTRSSPPVFGDFISDPKCYFDADTQRWFLTALQIDLDPATGAFGSHSKQYVAVSNTSDPTLTWSVFFFDTTDATGGAHASCPCFGDQPLIGADANGFYVSTNEYNLHPFGSSFNGAQIYAISKTAIEAAPAVAPTPIPVVQIDAGPMLLPSGGLAFSVQPATSPSAAYESANGGTEYFLSDLDFSAAPAIGTGASGLAVWALTNTASLSGATPSVGLAVKVIGSEFYGQPPNAEQKSGELFLGAATHNPLALVAGNDDRMNQVVFANGMLWAGANSAVQTPNGPTRVGVAYFIVAPSDPNGTLTASIAKQGYAAVNQENLLFPSIGVTSQGKAVITFALVGPDFFPSTAYASIDTSTGVGDIHIAALGQGPEDGFTGYDNPRAPGTGDIARWGDYTAAVADGDSVWFATEYIAHPATDLTTRTVLANWATFIANVTP
jgi:hypothetical protein